MSKQTTYALSGIQRPVHLDLYQLIKHGSLIDAWMHDISCIKSDRVDIYSGVFHGGMFHDGVFRGGVFHDGVFHDGVFRGGVFRGGVFHGGMFHDGVFRGGVFHGGMFHGGMFHGGVFHGGVFHGGVFHDGMFHGGVFHGGVFHGGMHNITPRVWRGTAHTCYACGVQNSHLKIGCEYHSVEHWLSNYERIGEKNGYSNTQITEYAQYIQEAYDAYKKETANAK